MLKVYLIAMKSSSSKYWTSHYFSFNACRSTASFMDVLIPSAEHTL